MLYIVEASTEPNGRSELNFGFFFFPQDMKGGNWGVYQIYSVIHAYVWPELGSKDEQMCATMALIEPYVKSRTTPWQESRYIRYLNGLLESIQALFKKCYIRREEFCLAHAENMSVNQFRNILIRGLTEMNVKHPETDAGGLDAFVKYNLAKGYCHFRIEFMKDSTPERFFTHIVNDPDPLFHLENDEILKYRDDLTAKLKENPEAQYVYTGAKFPSFHNRWWRNKVF